MSADGGDGERDLALLIRDMRPRLDPERLVYVRMAHDDRLPRDAGVRPRMVFEEREGATLILRRDEASWLGLQTLFPCRMITLEVHSSLDAVGFLARVAAALAAHSIPCNAVSAWHHDHLFVPEDRASQAMEVLKQLMEGGAA